MRLELDCSELSFRGLGRDFYACGATGIRKALGYFNHNNYYRSRFTAGIDGQRALRFHVENYMDRIHRIVVQS